MRSAGGGVSQDQVHQLRWLWATVEPRVPGDLASTHRYLCSLRLLPRAHYGAQEQQPHAKEYEHRKALTVNDLSKLH